MQLPFRQLEGRIGLRFDPGQQEWLWDGPWQGMFLAQSGFQNWMTERKDLPEEEICAKIDSNGKWHEMNCSDEIDVVCEKPKCKSSFNIM